MVSACPLWPRTAHVVTQLTDQPNVYQCSWTTCALSAVVLQVDCIGRISVKPFSSLILNNDWFVLFESLSSSFIWMFLNRAFFLKSHEDAPPGISMLKTARIGHIRTGSMRG